MQANDVRIVRLEPMRVAWSLGFGPSPEEIAWGNLLAFARSKGLAIDPQVHRFFGFNNPDPTPGSPNYGYEQWMVVGPEVEGEGEVKVKAVSGGLYAVTHCKLGRIFETWQELVAWVEASPYHPVWKVQCLEECLTPEKIPSMESEFDLYMPIME